MRVNTEPVVYIKAQVESATPDRTQWKPYSTTLTFPNKLYIEVPVPKSEVELGKDGEITLTLVGWTAFLNNYTQAVEDMNRQYMNQFR